MSTSQAAERLEFDLLDRLAKSLRVGNVGKGQMATHLGVSGNTVGNYLSGRTTPDRPTLIVWAMRCGVPLEWLLTGSTAPAGPDGETISHSCSDGSLVFLSNSRVTGSRVNRQLVAFGSAA